MERIVIADSNQTTLQTAGQIICRLKMRMTGFRTAQSLLDYLRDNRPDLIILGNVIWELGAFEAVVALRKAMGPGADVPVILLTDQEERELAENARAMGAAAAVSKPLTAAGLTSCVQSVLARQDLSGQPGQAADTARTTLEEISLALEECSESAGGMWMGKEAFDSACRRMQYCLNRSGGAAFQVLFTVEMPKNLAEARKKEIMPAFRRQLQHTLRSSDMMIEIGDNQVFLLLAGVGEADIGSVLARTIDEWKGTEYGSITGIATEVRQAGPGGSKRTEKPRSCSDWVVVVDDDVTNLKMAGLILSKQHMRVTALKSGRALLEYVRENKPDLILLDIKMPEMDGFETLQRLKEEMRPGQEIPVIFLTADENADSELKGLALGAMDFIKKPFVPDVLTLRVKHTIELVRLQKNLAVEVELKTRENESLSLHIVQTLAEAIDAKDTYTNGHSGRVAEYSREIARRYGYTSKKQDEIYMMGLLHDVGKIGVPDAVINKPDRLTEEEYEQIKRHPVLGDRILKKIQEMPKLSVGARWHHERYDGRGYPDGLIGEDILEEARIIAVADAYDAMTSRRSYREILPKEKVRQEIEQGKGTQFDPIFADIMLEMIDEDRNYEMREK